MCWDVAVAGAGSRTCRRYSSATRPTPTAAVTCWRCLTWSRTRRLAPPAAARSPTRWCGGRWTRRVRGVGGWGPAAARAHAHLQQQQAFRRMLWQEHGRQAPHIVGQKREGRGREWAAARSRRLLGTPHVAGTGQDLWPATHARTCGKTRRSQVRLHSAALMCHSSAFVPSLPCPALSCLQAS